MKKEVLKRIKNADSYIIVTEESTILNGMPYDLLSHYAILTKRLIDTLGEKEVREAIDIAFMSNEELKVKLINSTKERFGWNKNE